MAPRRQVAARPRAGADVALVVLSLPLHLLVALAVHLLPATSPAAAQCTGSEENCPLPLSLPLWMAGFMAAVWLAGLWCLVVVARWWARARAERRRARARRGRPGTDLRPG